jgi:cell division protein FtsZ
VLDERMGDDVKITVIATGFRHDQIGRQKHSAHDAMVPRLSVQSNSPRFASEEMAEQEYTQLIEARKPSEVSPVPVMREAESTPFALQPQPVMMGDNAVPVRTPVAHGKFDEPFEEEYARMVPAKGSAERGQESAHRNESEPHLEHLDIPAFLRR